MSRLAPFVDAAVSVDRTAWPNTFISYYTYGSAIGFGLDLAMRDKTNNRLSADTYMQALWQNYGARGQKVPGMVATPYTLEGLKGTLANVSGDPEFTKDFFAHYVEGRDLVDYSKLLLRAGFVVRKRNAGKPWMGGVQLQAGAGNLRVGGLVPFDSGVYNAGIEQDDQLITMDGQELSSTAVLDEILSRHKGGDAVPIRFVRRSGESVTTTLTLDEDPRVEVVPIEKTGGTLTADQKTFRDDWLNSPKK
jgi:predicted metalloprotease with PDZ domain